MLIARERSASFLAVEVSEGCNSLIFVVDFEIPKNGT